MVDEVRVLARADHQADYRRLVPDARVVPDAAPFAGPVAALANALPDQGHVVIASIDMPGLRSHHVRALLRAGQDRIACAETRDGALPTLAAGPAAHFRQRLATARRLRDLACGGATVHLDAPGLNVNTVEALALAG